MISLESAEFERAIRCLRGLDKCQHRDFIRVLARDAVKYYYESSRNLYRMSALVKSFHPQKLAAFGSVVLGVVQSDADPVDHHLIASHVKEQIKRTRKEHRLLGVYLNDLMYHFPDFEYALDAEDPKRVAAQKVEKEKMRMDKKAFSSTFSKADRRTFVQGGAPGLVQTKRSS